MNSERRKQIKDCYSSTMDGESLTVFKELLAEAEELEGLKQGLTLHPSVMTQQNVAMLAFKYDEVKKELERVKSERDTELKAVLDLIPNAVRVCEGGGPENLYASLAVSIATLRVALSDAKDEASRAWGINNSLTVRSALMEGRIAEHEGQGKEGAR